MLSSRGRELSTSYVQTSTEASVEVSLFLLMLVMIQPPCGPSFFGQSLLFQPFCLLELYHTLVELPLQFTEAIAAVTRFFRREFVRLAGVDLLAIVV